MAESASALNHEGGLEPRWLVNTCGIYHSPTVDVLPDNVLLEIFDFDRLSLAERSWEHPWQWHRLVHVCQRWRRVLFSSPRRLNLRLFCSNGTPVKETLEFWPALPIVMRYGGFPGSAPVSPEDEENLVTALRHPDRIYEIGITVTGSLCDRLAAEMQNTMSSLEALRLMVQGKAELLLPDQFLGGSAPLLSVISTYGVAFPALPKLLLLASNLVSLELWNIPRSGYFSPEALVMGLSVATQLKSFKIHFDFPISHFHARNLRTPLSGRTVLPALTNLKFWGVNEYFEDIVARIDAPLLELIDLRFFNRLVFEIPHLSNFIRRTSQLGSPAQAKIYSSGSAVSVTLTHQPGTPLTTIPGQLRLQITCGQFDWQLSAISQISSQLSPFLSGVGQLDIRTFPPSASGRDDLDPARWIELLRLFGGVERLRVVDELVLDIALALQRVTLEPEPELFPALRELSFPGNSRDFAAALEAIAPFISVRQLSGRPITVYNWDTNTFD
ncbi:hypothetical protein BJY52DRAFT_1184604 [Lactarius psammicola]|nr:hypothetical protein BJY52DRAFT_1184604 [Lactarius psammicola]